jgi:hypothetical protein
MFSKFSALKKSDSPDNSEIILPEIKYNASNKTEKMIIMVRMTTKALENGVFDTILFIGFCRKTDIAKAKINGRRTPKRYLKNINESTAKRIAASAK